jgi:hypothetical protein
MGARDFVAFLRRTAAKHPSVYREVMKALGPMKMARWGVHLVRGALAGGA